MPELAHKRKRGYQGDYRLNSVAPGEVAIRIVTVNLHKGFSAFNRRFILPELRRALQEMHADIVFLQEVIGAHAGHALRYPAWPQVPQYEYLADTLWKDFAYGRNAVYPHGHHGNALLSKYPICHSRNLDVSVHRSEQRGLLHCTLQLQDMQSAPVHTICVHLGLRERHRRKQLDLLCRVIDELPADSPLIVAGDFNDWRGFANQFLIERSGLEEIFSAVDGLPAITFPAAWPLLRLDRIYVRNVRHRPLPVGTRPWSRLSDHAPLAAEIRITTDEAQFA